MWIFTNFGFFSVVQKRDDDNLTVRARARGDLDNLRKRIPLLGPTLAGAGTDYPYRATIGKNAWAIGMAKICQDIDYPNFKNSISQVQGPGRAMLYERVWSTMRALEKRETEWDYEPVEGD